MKELAIDAAAEIAARLERLFEGFRARPYLCPANVPTIGYGRVIGRQGDRLPDIETTPESEEAWLAAENSRLAVAILRHTRVALTEAQLGALIDFAYNVGLGAYQMSTLRQKLNRGEYGAAADELLRWVRGGGRMLPGLVRRRGAERALFLA